MFVVTPPTSSEPDKRVSDSVLADLRSYVREFGNASGESADRVIQSKCSCGNAQFWMECSEEDGVARRTCTSCHLVAYIGDSREHWDGADTGDATCPCGKKVFDIVVGYCLRADSDEVNWMIVGARCATCSAIGVYADWSIDFEPSKALLDQS